MLKHIVIFTLKLEGNTQEKQAHLQKIKEELEALTQKIPQLIEMKVAANVNPQEADGFILEAIVNDFDDLNIYAQHPAHVAVVQRLIAPYKESRSCIDFEV